MCRLILTYQTKRSRCPAPLLLLLPPRSFLLLFIWFSHHRLNLNAFLSSRTLTFFLFYLKILYDPYPYPPALPHPSPPTFFSLPPIIPSPPDPRVHGRAVGHAPCLPARLADQREDATEVAVPTAGAQVVVLLGGPQ